MKREFYNQFRQSVATAQNETEVRSAFNVTSVVVLGISDLKHERGRSDLSRNRVIFEFKDKDLFRGNVGSSAFKEAFQQLTEKYIPGQAEKDNAAKEDYIGVAIDGIHFASLALH